MKAFVNLLIQTDNYCDVEELKDNILHILEEESETEGFKVIWSKSKEVKDD